MVAGSGFFAQQGEQRLAVGVPDLDRPVVGLERTGEACQPGWGFAGFGGRGIDQQNHGFLD